LILCGLSPVVHHLCSTYCDPSPVLNRLLSTPYPRQRGTLKGACMKSFSIAVDVAWQIAVREASAAASQFIEKEHVVIGIMSLPKVAAGAPDDMKLDRKQWNSVRAEWAALNEVFSAVPLNTTSYRRELRKKLGKGSHNHHTEKVIHRSPECKAFFKIAAALSGNSNEISVMHLLAVL